MIEIDEILQDTETKCCLCHALMPRVDHFFRLENHGWVVIAHATNKTITFYCPKHKDIID